MQQVFSCPRCGWQNTIGQRFCTGCGNKFIYNCPQCGSVIDPSYRFCPDCRTGLGWPEQQETQPLPVGQKTYYEPRSTYSYGRREPQRKQTSSSQIGYFGLIVGIVFLVGAGIFAINSGLQGTPSAAPPATSQPTDTSPALTEIPPSEPEGDGQEPDYKTPPEYIQQYTDIQPPYVGASFEPIRLVNNPDAKDISFAELKSFILEDDTDEETYIVGVRMCGDFAETLHNNAERADIRAAWVGIDFAGEEIGHAFNAFQTTDRGLVYIDCTGEGLKGMTYEELLYGEPHPCEYDTIAYVEIGKEYGGISIDKAESLQYSFYIEYTQNWQKYDNMLEDYNNEVAAFNQALGGRTTLAEPEYSEFKAWEAELAEKERILDGLARGLGNCWFGPLGIVESVEIYW